MRITCFALFYNFCVSCGGATLDTVHMYILIYVAAVGLPMCYVAIVWLWSGIFMWCVTSWNARGHHMSEYLFIHMSGKCTVALCVCVEFC